MAETPWSKFRLGVGTLAALDALAASNGGNRSAALREAVGQWRAAVEAAARANAEELSREDWTRLAHLNDPDPFGGLLDDDPPTHGRDWSAYLAAELIGAWEGRPVVLPAHKAERRESAGLAKRVAAMGRVRGYALMAALRYFWKNPEAGITSCSAPEVWLTPTAREGG